MEIKRFQFFSWSTLLTLGSLLGFGFLIYQTDFSQVVALIVRLKGHLLIFLMLALAWNFLRGFSWWNFFSVKKKSDLFRAFALSTAAEGLSYILPFGSLSSESLRWRATQHLPDRLFIIAVDKFNFYLSTLIFFALSLLFLNLSQNEYLYQFSLPGLNLGLILVFFFLFLGFLIFVFRNKLISYLPRESFKKLNKKSFLISLSANCLVRLLKFSELLLMLFILQSSLDFLRVLCLLLLMLVVNTLSALLPASMGPKELGYMAAMQVLGVGTEVATAILLFQKLREILFGLWGAWVWWGQKAAIKISCQS